MGLCPLGALMWTTNMFVQLGDKEIFLVGKSKAWCCRKAHKVARINSILPLGGVKELSKFQAHLVFKPTNGQMEVIT